MALSPEDQAAGLYPGIVPYDWNDEYEEQFRQAMMPQIDPALAPIDPMVDPLSAATTLGPKGTGPGPTPAPPPIEQQIGLRPLGDRIGTPKPPPPQQIGAPPIGIVGPDEIAHGNQAEAPTGPGATPAAPTFDPSSFLGGVTDPYLMPAAPPAEGAAAPAEAAAPTGPAAFSPTGFLQNITDPYVALTPEDKLTDDELNQRARTETREQFLDRQLRHERLVQTKKDAEELRLANEDNQRAQKEHDDFKEDQAAQRADSEKLAAEATALANEQIKPENWWHSRSTGQKIAAAIAAIAGGLSGKEGSMAWMKDAIDRDIDAQKANLANRRALLGDRKMTAAEKARQRAEDYRDQTMFRVASLQRARNLLAKEAQKYDPRGAAAIAYGLAHRGLKAEEAKAVQAYQREQLKNRMEERKLANTEALGKETIRASKEQGAQGWTRLKDARNFHGDQMQLENKKLDGEIAKATKEGRAKDAENLQRFGVGGLTYGDSTPFIAQGTPEGVEKVRNQVGAARTLVGLLDEARRIRTGYTNSAKGRDEWQKLKTIWAANKAVAKEMIGLGALSDSDFDLLNEFLGAADPTGTASIAAGVEQARKNILRMARTNLSAHDPRAGTDGAVQFDIPDPLGKHGESSDFDKQLQRVLTNKPRTDADRAALDKYKAAGKGDFITEESKAALEQWAQEARSNDPTIRDRALAGLDTAAKTGRGTVKRLAAELLQGVTGDVIKTTEPIDAGPAASTSRETGVNESGFYEDEAQDREPVSEAAE
jgi:hypothetical protein